MLNNRVNIRDNILVLVLISFSATSLYAEDLMDAYHTALTSSPVFHAQVSKEEARKTSVKKAWSGLLPKAKAEGYIERAGLNSSYKNPSVFNAINATPIFKKTDNLYEYGLEVEQPLFNMKNFISLSTSRKSALASDISYALAKQALMIQVAQKYFQVLSAEDDLTAINKEKDILSRQLKTATHLVDHGLDTRISLSEVNTSLNMVLAEEIEAKNKLQKSRDDLAIVIGQDVSDVAPLRKVVVPHEPVPDTIEVWQSASLRGNLLVQLNQLGTELAHMNIKLAQSHFYPELNAIAGISRNQGFLPGFGMYDQTQKSAGVELSIPLSSGGYDVANVHQAEKILESKYYELDAVRLTVKEQTGSVFNTIHLLIQKLYADQVALDSAEQMQTYMMRAYQLGTRTMSDVLNADHEVYQAENNKRNDIYAYFLATLELKALTGSLEEKDLATINHFFV